MKNYFMMLINHHVQHDAHTHIYKFTYCQDAIQQKSYNVVMKLPYKIIDIIITSISTMLWGTIQ